MSDGWVKLHRKIWDNPLFHEKRIASRLEAWVDIIMQANYKDQKVFFENMVIDVERGSFITSEVKLAARWGWSRTKVRSFLMLLESEKMIVKKSDSKKTALTVCNYSLYQDSETTDKTTEKQLKNTTKKVKKEKKKDTTIPYTKIEEAYNSICISLPKIKLITDNRMKSINARWETLESLEGFAAYFEAVERSDFLTGRTENNDWKADFDWLMNQQNMSKVLEGKYNNKQRQARSNVSIPPGFKEV
jgi:hypothetical protein